MQMPQDDLDLSEHLVDFLQDCQHRDLSQRTINTYRTSIRQYIASQGEALPTRPSVRRWLTSMSDLAPSTRSIRLASVRALCSFLVVEKIIPDNPLKDLRGPKLDPLPVDPYTAAEVQAMLDACGYGSFIAKRDAAILTLFITTGMRLSEVAGIRLQNVDTANMSILLPKTKSRKPRTVPYGHPFAIVLKRYLRQRQRHKFADSPYLWIGERNPSLSVHATDTVVRKVGRKAGVPNARAHRFRHSFAVTWLAEGGSETGLMTVAGWSNSNLIRRYAAAKRDDLARDEYKRLFGGKLKGSPLTPPKDFNPARPAMSS